MKVELYFNQSLDKNASMYYERAKKAKGKLEGIRKAISTAEKSLEQEQQKQAKDVEQDKSEKKPPRKKEWYEKFHWFFTSEGKLVIGGRDATTNEAVIKKHTDKEDLVFHTDMAGSPFVVIKSEGKEITELEKQEAAEFLACYSKAWKAGISSVEVFYVLPEQVTKEAQSGEFLSKGSFMIKGKTNYINAVLRLCISVIDDVVYYGPLSALRSLLQTRFPEKEKKDLDRYIVNIVQGSEKTSQVAKAIKRKLGGDLDELIRALPPGGCKIGK
ncbi:MAG: NFACT RNA binding domain-containing protein [Candidatus Woesearchaeota archaeon]